MEAAGRARGLSWAQRAGPVALAALVAQMVDRTLADGSARFLPGRAQELIAAVLIRTADNEMERCAHTRPAAAGRIPARPGHGSGDWKRRTGWDLRCPDHCDGHAHLLQDEQERAIWQAAVAAWLGLDQRSS